MKEKLAHYREKLRQVWGQMGKKQKLWLGATAGVLLLSVVMLIFIFSKTEYEVAFQNLDATDAAAIMNYLDSNGISYQLSPNGDSISVPSAVASRVKVDVASQGLVQNGTIGFEAFNTGASQFGMTDNEFNVKYRNALNGEIERLLNGMQGVQSSNVLVNLPEESVFMVPEDQERASASIRINFKTGYRPSQEEVDGYFNLVRTAVPKLAIEDITISSPAGELLPSEKLTGTGGAVGTVDKQFEIQRKYETDLKRNIQQFLGRIVGADNVVVSVASSLNFDRRSTEENLVRPLENNDNNGIIISEQETSRSVTGQSGAGTGGVVGTGETDIPGYQATEGAGTSSSEETSRTTNYEVSRVHNKIESAPFVVKDLAISVGIKASSLSEEQLNQVQTSIVNLVRGQLVDSGQDVTNDELMAKKVTLIAQEFAAEEGEQGEAGLSLAWWVGIGAAALALVGGAAYVIARRRKQQEETEELPIPTKVEYPTLDLENVGGENQARKNLESLAKRKPDEFVNLLRTWLADE
ncbi:flagellar M-ring protein FliF [Paenibacillus sp. 32O-W]|uniref:flagellar basal-body MS-ring/collar protein FliF n=1 Tax=Paenibacillus sp. 32O-W TaxID=1695218 RepID=UPI0007206794|nr:flagellar basal-body MS-ring/collar protein FliF [Paenibacillus sp. 32O-W]ALS27545.1 flagellar M-ring protein FliF [Paenibacillus sp. 32O-W]